MARSSCLAQRRRRSGSLLAVCSIVCASAACGPWLDSPYRTAPQGTVAD
ncbi:hypothetical protein ACY3NT_003215 [Enterobacter sichuanensis]